MRASFARLDPARGREQKDGALHRIRDTRTWPSPSSLELQPDDMHQSVRYLLVTFELGRVCDQDLAVIEIDDRFVVECDFGQFFVDRLALRRIVKQARIFKQLVGL